MPIFNIVTARCKRYEIEAESEAEALDQIRTDWYAMRHREFREKYEDQEVDFFTKFEGEGEVLDERGEVTLAILERLKERGEPKERSFFDDYDIDDLAKLYDELAPVAVPSPVEGMA